MNKDFKRMEELEDITDCEIISYGLMPNPNGYCFEYPLEKPSKKYLKKFEAELKELDELCNTAKKGYFERGE